MTKKDINKKIVGGKMVTRQDLGLLFLTVGCLLFFTGGIVHLIFMALGAVLSFPE